MLIQLLLLCLNLKLSVTPPEGSDRGWGRLDIRVIKCCIRALEPVGDAVPMTATVDWSSLAGAWVVGLRTTDATDVGVVGFAVWQRSFAEQAGNYGRMVEHSTIASSVGSIR